MKAPSNITRQLGLVLVLGLFACGDDASVITADAGPDSAALPSDALQPAMDGGQATDVAVEGDAPPAARCQDNESEILDDQDPRAVQADGILQNAYGGSRPGVAALIMVDGKVLLKKGYGLADIAAARPITPCSTFDLASVAKHFTAAGILLLVQDGKLSLEDDVRGLLPELPEFDASNPIRIRHLLHHTSGLPDYLDHTLDLSDAQFGALINEDVLPIIAGLPLDFPTGSKFAYSNTNYVLAALIIKRAAQQSFSGFMKQRFFDPLDMYDTLVFDENTTSVTGRVTGYFNEFGTFYPDRLDGGINGDGNVFTSVHDLERWEAQWRAPTLLAKDSVDLAYTSGVAGGSETGYGLGWGIEKAGGHLVVSHDGSWVGTSTYVERRVDHGLSVWLLSNDEVRDPYEEVMGSIAALFP